MSTPVQHKASAGDKAPTLRCVKPAEPALPDAAGLMPFNSWRMETIEQLQSTLILRSQLCLFLDQMEKIVAIDGIHYRNEEEGVDLEINRQSSHSCGYRLITDTGYVGELVFTREEMFSESELTALETSLSLLLNPLRNALRYRRAVDAAQKDPVTGSNTRDSMHETLAREIDRLDAEGQTGVIACSGLRRIYRDWLREGVSALYFVHLDTDYEVLMQRMQARTGHFMPASLLQSQLATLEPLQEDELGTVVDVRDSPHVVVERSLAALAAAGLTPHGDANQATGPQNTP